MNALTLWFHKLGSPPYFYRFAGRLLPWLYGAAIAIAAVGLYYGLVRAPADYLQGESVRILYIHVPCAWMSLFAYLSMAGAGFVAVVWRIKLAELVAMACAPIGAAFTFVTLVSGALWGRPTWGTYWVWDARLTSELVLLFLYFGVIGLYRAFDDPRRGARAACLLALIGVVNLPIVHYSVVWWNTLHQGQSVRLMGESSIHPSMLWPLLLMALATHVWFFASLFARVRVAVLEQEGGKDWVRALAREESPA
ncbi:MAG TPA: heme ABC transporter permease [Xanthomonadales bacterium]|nr:heme ABC transporter permease [Xanthomonadales bacterium]